MSTAFRWVRRDTRPSCSVSEGWCSPCVPRGRSSSARTRGRISPAWTPLSTERTFDHLPVGEGHPDAIEVRGAVLGELALREEGTVTHDRGSHRVVRPDKRHGYHVTGRDSEVEGPLGEVVEVPGIDVFERTRSGEI